MHTSIDPDLHELEDAVKALSARLNTQLIDFDNRGCFPEQKWKIIADCGLLGVSTSAQYGGLGKDILTTMSLLQALGYTCEDSGLNFTVGSQIVSAIVPLHSFATKEQQTKYLPKLVNGHLIGAHAITEPDTGSDAYAMKTLARRHGDGYLLNGSKTFVTSGPIADVFIVYALSDPKKGIFGGISAFIVEKQTAGFSLGKPIDKMGLRTSPFCELFFDECDVPASQLLGKEGSGYRILEQVITWEILCFAAIQIGEMEKLIEKCIGYSKSREQFGQSINKFQAVSHKIVDMKIGLEAAKAIAYRTASLYLQGQDYKMDVAISKVLTSEHYVNVALNAVQIFGAYGYTKSYGVEAYLRDSIAAKIYSGSSEIQRNMIAALLGL